MAVTIVSMATVVENSSCNIGSRIFDEYQHDKITWSSVHNLSGHAMSISMWIYTTHDYSYVEAYLIDILQSGDSATAISLKIISNTILSFFRSGLTNSLMKWNTCPSLTGGVWHNIVVTHTGVFGDHTSISIYVDGAYLSSELYGSNGMGELNCGGTWTLGPNLITTEPFAGRMCEVGVWDVELNAGEVASLASGYAPSLVNSGNLIFYFPENTSSLNADPPDVDGTNYGTTWSGIGPDIIR